MPTYNVHRIYNSEDDVIYYKNSGLKVVSADIDSAIDTMRFALLEMCTLRDFIFGLHEVKISENSKEYLDTGFTSVAIKDGKVVNTGWVNCLS